MGGVGIISSVGYALPISNRRSVYRVHRVQLPEIVNKRYYPTYYDGLAVGREALERVRKANLAAAAAIYSYRMLGPR
jgi:hypothetical protein